MTSLPHILLVNVFFAPHSYGGATVVAEEVAAALHSAGQARVTAVSMCSRGDLPPYHILRSQTGGVVNLMINLPGGRSFSEIYSNPQVSEHIARLMDQLAPDMVHAHCVQDIGAGFMAEAAARGIPLVLSVHDFWWICSRQFMIRPDQGYCGQNPVKLDTCRSCVENFSAARTRADYLKRQAALADVITYPSQFAMDLCKNSGLNGKKSLVWTNGVHLPRADFHDKQATRRARDPRLTFAFLGGPSQIKGWPLIREAFTDLGRTDFRGLLVDGSLDNSWWKAVKIEALDGEWQIVERFSQAQMDDFYQDVDVLLFPSQWKETFGLAIREALARGIHVIQTDSGGTTEHGAVVPERLIPIGAGPEALRAQVIEVLDKGLGTQAVPAIQTYDGQAAEFMKIIAPFLTNALDLNRPETPRLVG